LRSISGVSTDIAPRSIRSVTVSIRAGSPMIVRAYETAPRAASVTTFRLSSVRSFCA
jgi:hypothetical protein